MVYLEMHVKAFTAWDETPTVNNVLYPNFWMHYHASIVSHSVPCREAPIAGKTSNFLFSLHDKVHIQKMLFFYSNSNDWSFVTTI